jgi:hypothetical protein
MDNDIQPLSVELDLRAVTITFADPQKDSAAATEITQLMIDPARYEPYVAEIVDDIRALVAQVQTDQRNPPARIR